MARLGEWAVLTVLATAGSVTVIDPTADPVAGEPGRPGAACGTQVPAGLRARQVGEFVGRRRAQRRWPAELLGPLGTGLVVPGIGGVGKTTLAAELVQRITERDPGRLTVIAASSLTGGHGFGAGCLIALARALRRRSGWHFLHGLDQAEQAPRPDRYWQDTPRRPARGPPCFVPVLLVLDNFEDNLTADSAPGRPGWRSVADQDLAALLAALAAQPGQCRLLITSRYPFVLPGQAERVLSFQPIGPLSPRPKP